MSNKIHWFMCMGLGAGSRGSTRHFRTTTYPESLQGLNVEPISKKGRTRSISTLIDNKNRELNTSTSFTNGKRSGDGSKNPSSNNNQIAEPFIFNPERERNFRSIESIVHDSPFQSKFLDQDALSKESKDAFSMFVNKSYSTPGHNYETLLNQAQGGGQSQFVNRHLGVRIGHEDYETMLKAIGVSSLAELIDKTVPESIRISDENDQAYINATGAGLSEYAAGNLLQEIAERNIQATNYIGQGWNPSETPSIIANNVLRNPAWNTAYTPYQAEISQGRLEALFNFQTMIVELTGLELANASLLDESTACAEAMSLCFSVGKNKKKTFFIDDKCHPQNIHVMQTRASLKGFNTIVCPRSEFDFEGEHKGDVAGCIVQYPDTEGKIHDYENIVEAAHENKALVAVACDPLALTIMKAPGEFNADIALGTTQRFGIPLWLGGPHAAFFATKNKYKRLVPGRIIGKTVDSNGNDCYRLALQTREQHIKRDKATSNVCTAQALLANGSAFYGIYHGPEGLKRRARSLNVVAKILRLGVKTAGHKVEHEDFFDTIKISVAGSRQRILDRATRQGINMRKFNDGVSLSISLNDIITRKDIEDLLLLFGCEKSPEEILEEFHEDLDLEHKSARLSRVNENFMYQRIFNSYHSEQDFSRYCRQLELKDLSLVDSMIPLGSCTMKLNSSISLDSMSNPYLANIHPLQPHNQCQGWYTMLNELEEMLCETCGFDAFFLQPNSGAQGELAGLATIRSYHEANGEGNTRKIILIPTSAHGTNPASAALCGYKIKPINVNPDGTIDVEDLDKKLSKLGNQVAGCMITYPSTYGVFDSNIKEICDKIHEVGGQIYLDGANMNAQLGLCRPGDYGADVSHLNLHKTFSGPHGGGGPGAGPIGVKSHLIQHLPDNALYPMRANNAAKTQGALAGTDFGSPLVLAISWIWMKMLGAEGMRDSSKLAILNANYMKSKLEKDYDVLFKGDQGFCAHEFIIDIRPFKKYGIGALDVCKRLQDFGLHAGTMSWPIADTLMFEPTESESKKDIDNYCEALLKIRQEIELIARGEYDPENNPLKNAPHTLATISHDEWDKPYSRDVAAFPADFVKIKKTWPTVGRADDVYGDTNLICSCDGMENYK